MITDMKKFGTILLYSMLFTSLGCLGQKLSDPMGFHQLVAAGKISEVASQLKKGLTLMA